ncbi:exported hypothetical protein [Candidatus Sulfopaludibacter sp. SbA6]|nr:exported hypothetical protein [Candidatus Sulfopaludibacter sp. SbA6]
MKLRGTDATQTLRPANRPPRSLRPLHRRRRPGIRMPQINQPTGRCASALAWAMAARPALGCTDEEIQLAFHPPLPPHPMVEAVRNLLDQRKHRTGSATELLDLLQPFASCQTPKGVSQQLKNCTRALASNPDPGRQRYRVEIPPLTRRCPPHRPPRGPG